MEQRMKDDTVGTKSVSVIVGPGSGKSIIADLIALYEITYTIKNKRGVFCHATTRAHLLDQRKLENRRRMPESLLHRFVLRLTDKLPEKAEAYCIDEFDEAFDQDLVRIEDNDLKGMKCLFNQRVYFVSASCKPDHERILLRAFDCSITKFKTAYELSTGATSNVEMHCSIHLDSSALMQALRTKLAKSQATQP